MVEQIGDQALVIAVGWELYERTRSALALGMVGLVAGLPMILLALPGGHFADSHDRRRIVMISGTVVALSALGLAAVSYSSGPVLLIYVALLIGGLAQAFKYPARIALLPQIVPRDKFANAMTWNSTAFLASAVTG